MLEMYHNRIGVYTVNIIPATEYYKLAQPDGWDFYTGNTINYRQEIGNTVTPPKANNSGKLCSSAFIHASDKPNKCFIGAEIPCSAYLVEGMPSICDDDKCGFVELAIVKEITDLDKLFGWVYAKIANPTKPLLSTNQISLDIAIEKLKVWTSARTSVGASVRGSVWTSVRASVRASVKDSIRGSVWASVRDSIGAYIGSAFPNISKWEYTEHTEGDYPYQSCVDLWEGGYIPSFDGKVWRLQSGEQAELVYETKI